MRDWRTTMGAGGVLAGAVLQQTVSPDVGSAVVAFFAAMIGLLAKDHEKEGLK